MKRGDYMLSFSSGRTIDPNRGIVGLAPNGAVYEGYDGRIWDPEVDQEFQNFSPNDMRELADAMIARWQEFKAALPKT